MSRMFMCMRAPCMAVMVDLFILSLRLLLHACIIVKRMSPCDKQANVRCARPTYMHLA
jgi:hypothetical protein